MTRKSVGICDVTTLGKIDIQGSDAAEFLNKVYVNGFAKLPVDKVRYGLMLREDGIAFDDGTTARLAENHFVMTTTTANAVLAFRRLEFARQCLWPELDVHLISTTDGWAQFAVAGPNSRNLLRKIVDEDHDISNEAFPFMGCGEITICGGTPARLFRISFSGELAYEIAVPARYGNSLMKVLMQAGEEFDAAPYGTEALGVMRIEKGHAAGNELNGQTTALNLGFDRMVSKKKDCIGNTLSERPDLNRDDVVKLVGFRPVNLSDKLSAGAHFINKGETPNTENDQGWMSSIAYSPYHTRFFNMLPIPEDTSFELKTDDICGFNVAGPKSRQLLQQLSNTDFSTEVFPFMRSMRISVAGIKVIAIRVSFTGDLGWELHCDAKDQVALYEALITEAIKLDGGPVGGRALGSLRIEKGYGSWGREYSPEYFPNEVGLERLVKMDKDFLNKSAYANIKDNPPAKSCPFSKSR